MRHLRRAPRSQGRRLGARGGAPSEGYAWHAPSLARVTDEGRPCVKSRAGPGRPCANDEARTVAERSSRLGATRPVMREERCRQGTEQDERTRGLNGRGMGDCTGQGSGVAGRRGRGFGRVGLAVGPWTGRGWGAEGSRRAGGTTTSRDSAPSRRGSRPYWRASSVVSRASRSETDRLGEAEGTLWPQKTGAWVPASDRSPAAAQERRGREGPSLRGRGHEIGVSGRRPGQPSSSFWGEHGPPPFSSKPTMGTCSRSTPERAVQCSCTTSRAPVSTARPSIRSSESLPTPTTGGSSGSLGRRTGLPVHAYPETLRPRHSEKNGVRTLMGLLWRSRCAEAADRAEAERVSGAVSPGVWTSGEIKASGMAARGRSATTSCAAERTGSGPHRHPPLPGSGEPTSGSSSVRCAANAGLLNTPSARGGRTSGKTRLAVAGGTHLSAPGRENLADTVSRLGELQLSHPSPQPSAAGRRHRGLSQAFGAGSSTALLGRRWSVGRSPGAVVGRPGRPHAETRWGRSCAGCGRGPETAPPRPR